MTYTADSLQWRIDGGMWRFARDELNQLGCILAELDVFLSFVLKYRLPHQLYTDTADVTWCNGLTKCCNHWHQVTHNYITTLAVQCTFTAWFCIKARTKEVSSPCPELPVSGWLEAGQIMIRLLDGFALLPTTQATVHSHCHLWLAPLWVCSATSRQQPPDWSVLAQFNCFGPWQPVGVEVVLCHLHSDHSRLSQQSLPVHRSQESQNMFSNML